MIKSMVKRAFLLTMAIALSAVCVFNASAPAVVAKNAVASSYKVYMRFPGGKPKCVTLGFDDGIMTDEQVVDTVTQSKLKATFYLIPGNFAADGKEGSGPSAYISASVAKKLYSNEYCEVASHTRTHKNLSELDEAGLNNEVLGSISDLKSIMGKDVTGFAYPNGNVAQVEWLRSHGVKYARTADSSGDFLMPNDWLQWKPTAYFPTSGNIAKKFFDKDTILITEPYLLFLWCHSYDFAKGNSGASWGMLENFCSQVEDKSDEIWCATNGEVYNYSAAFDKLVVDKASDTIKNPTSTNLWIGYKSKSYEVKAGATITGLFSGTYKPGDTAVKTNGDTAKQSTPKAKKNDTKQTESKADEKLQNTDSEEVEYIDETDDGEENKSDNKNIIWIIVGIIGAALVVGIVIIICVAVSSKKDGQKDKENNAFDESDDESDDE